MARLAIAKDVLADYAKLDRSVQNAVEAAIARFAKDPHADLHLEKVPGSRDGRIRVLRVDSTWHGVVLAPDNGDTYCLVTILPQAKASAYATSRRFSVNQALGVLEVSDEEAIQQLRPSLQATAGPEDRRLFADVSDADLTWLGIDVQILSLVRLLASDADLVALESVLPDVQYAALHALARGMTVDEAWTEVTRLLPSDTPPEQVDTGDLVAALERTPDQVTFVSGQEELQLILAHPFAAWRTFLHPSQRTMAYRASYSGPAQVTGGPGTGKTVTVLHRAAFLAARTITSSVAGESPGAGQVSLPGTDARPVLLTTFNGNLAEALQTQLDLLIPDSVVRQRIEVLNVDRLAYSIVKRARGNPVIADERTLRARWAEAAAEAGLDFTPAFLKNEWEQVILAQDLHTEQAYLTCLRTGRGRPLTKAQRSRVWQAAQQVTAGLVAARQSTHLQLANEATHLLRQAGLPLYRHILVDEAQDLHPSQWRLLRAAVAPGPDDLFIAADPHQRIYDNRVSLASMRISVRGRSRRLSLNYRTTEEILAWAVPVLGTDPVTGLDGEVDSLLGYRSPMHGPRPQLHMAGTRAEELAFLSERIRSWLDTGIEPHAIGVAARSAGLVREAREALSADGIVTAPLSGRGSAHAVRAGTMHAMKGLEFQAVAVIGVEQGQVPEPAAVTPETEDAVAHGQDLQRERCVLFVACTRGRDHLHVSGTGEPSVFVPPLETEQPSSGHDDVSPQSAEEPAGTRSAGPRKVGMRELLHMREDSWRPRLRGASLVAEADLRPEFTDQVAGVMGRLYGKLDDPRLDGEAFLLRWPACLAAAMAGVAATRYEGGIYWRALWEVTGFQGTAQDQGIWGRAFNRAVGRLGMATFPELPLHFVGPILMHAGIPTYCLGDYFRLLLSRRRLDPGIDAESFLAWGTAPGRIRRLAGLDVPARRFLTEGGDYALDVVDRCLDLLDRLSDLDPDLDGVRLPARIVKAAREEAAGQGLDKPAARPGESKARTSVPRPRIGLDPYGVGVQVILPAVGEAPDGVATWRVTADGDPVTVRSRAQWVGAAESAPETAHPLSRPVRTVHVSLVGWDHVSELDVVQSSDPILLFSEDGRRLPAQLPLPPDHVWILRPADRDLITVGDLRTITETPVPFGWEGWHLQLASMEKTRSLSLRGGPSHVVQGYARPRLLLGGPLQGVTTPYGSPVYPQPPHLWLPDTAGSVISWHVDIRPAAGGTSLVSQAFEQPGTVDIWAGVPRPILGAFDITVRGPLGRGMRRTIFVAEDIAVSYRPAVRALRLSGLEPGHAEFHAPIGAAVSPGRLSFGASDRAHIVELRAGAETEPVVITPPHVDLLCAGAGASTWTAAPIHAATEAMADLGRLLVRAPGIVVKADLEVWAGPHRIQTIPPSGGQAPGLTGYDLPRASATVAHHGRAEFFLPWGQNAMPVGFVRPRRLATGADISSGQLRIRDCVPVDGLTAALYLARAPWRAPVVLPVPGNGVVPLPPDAYEAGPLRVLLRVEDPWTVTDWPGWPGRNSYPCDAPGTPASTDPEEDAFSRFLAGQGDLPALPHRLERLWRLIHLADDLIATGAPPNLRERCSTVLRHQPERALMGLLDSGLDSAGCVAGLISAGLSTARPVIENDWRGVERLWGVVPAAAAVLSSRLLAEPARPDDDPSAVLLDAALAQCGPNLDAVLCGDRDPAAQVGQFGPDAERMAMFSAEQVEAVWQAAAVVPQSLLDTDTRAVAARQMFDARRSPGLVGAARDATSIVRSAERLVAASPYRHTVAQVTARRHPDGKGGWLALPAMSTSLALVARIAARGDEACQSFERAWRHRWADLAWRAPDLTSIDLVLAEALIAGAERARFAEESA
ncbi:MAG: UvrD-helicase domain-containing protein [Streptosporangiaceae bacterium]